MIPLAKTVERRPLLVRITGRLSQQRSELTILSPRVEDLLDLRHKLSLNFDERYPLAREGAQLFRDAA